MTLVPIPTGTWQNQDPRSSGRRLVNCMSEIAPQTSEADLKSTSPPAYLRRMFGISDYAAAGDNVTRLLLHADGPLSTANGPLDSSEFNNPVAWSPGAVTFDTADPKFGASDLQFITGSDDPFFDSVILLAHFNQNLVDSSKYNHTIVPLNNTGAYSYDTATPQFGSAALALPFLGSTGTLGTFTVEVAGNLNTPLDIIRAGTGQWTVECWVRFPNTFDFANSGGPIGHIFTLYDLANSSSGPPVGFPLYLFATKQTSSQLSITLQDQRAFGQGTSINTILTSAPGAWLHLAVVGNPTTGVRFYAGGNWIGSATTWTQANAISAQSDMLSPFQHTIGSNRGYSGNVPERDIDDFRISAVERYFGTGTYTVPAAQFPDVGQFFASAPIVASGALDVSSKAFTLEGWVRIPNTVSAGKYTIAAFNDNTPTEKIALTTTIPGSGTSTLDLTVSGTKVSTITATINDGNWHYWTVMVDPLSNKSQVWLDGAQGSVGTYTDPAFDTGIFYLSYTDGTQLPGFIDEVRLNAELTYAFGANVPVPTQPFGLVIGGTAGAPVRGMRTMAGVTYVVIGENLYTMARTVLGGLPQDDATLTQLATGIAGGSGFVRLCDNTECLFILIPNTNIGYTYTTANGFAQMLDETFTFFGAKDVWFIDSYMVFLALNGLEFYNDDGQVTSGTGPITFTTGGVFPREFGTDRFVGMCVDHRTVHMFGELTSEGYVDAGNAQESPFAAAPDAFMQIGCYPSCGYTVALQDQAVMWVANDLTVRRLNGQTPVRISNSGVENFLEQNKDKLSGSYALTPTVGGHPLWVLTMPLAKATLVYDCLTTEWFNLESLFNRIGYWRPLCWYNAQGLQLVGDSQSSRVGFLDGRTFHEWDEPQSVRLYSQSIYDNHSRISHNRVEVVVTAGGAEKSGEDAKITLFKSDDSGATFKALATKSLGIQGARESRTFWMKLGQSRDRTYMTQISDPTPTFTVQMVADLVGGRW